VEDIFLAGLSMNGASSSLFSKETNDERKHSAMEKRANKNPEILGL